MSSAKLDGETRVHEYLTSTGFRVERFTKSEMSRTPDFRVLSGDALAFYCEVKTAQEDEWLAQQLAAAPPLTLQVVFARTRRTTRISDYIHSAVAIRYRQSVNGAPQCAGHRQRG